MATGITGRAARLTPVAKAIMERAERVTLRVAMTRAKISMVKRSLTPERGTMETKVITTRKLITVAKATTVKEMLEKGITLAKGTMAREMLVKQTTARETLAKETMARESLAKATT